jgi:hypothetical protein
LNIIQRPRETQNIENLEIDHWGLFKCWTWHDLMKKEWCRMHWWYYAKFATISQRASYKNPVNTSYIYIGTATNFNYSLVATNWVYHSTELQVEKMMCQNRKKRNDSTYQTHWLLCAAIASKLLDGLQLTRQYVGWFEFETKEDSQMSTAPMYLRNMFRLTYISKKETKRTESSHTD